MSLHSFYLFRPAFVLRQKQKTWIFFVCDNPLHGSHPSHKGICGNVVVHTLTRSTTQYFIFLVFFFLAGYINIFNNLGVFFKNPRCDFVLQYAIRSWQSVPPLWTSRCLTFWLPLPPPSRLALDERAVLVFIDDVFHLYHTAPCVCPTDCPLRAAYIKEKSRQGTCDHQIPHLYGHSEKGGETPDRKECCSDDFRTA